MIEEWRSIAWAPAYEVSSLGRVKGPRGPVKPFVVKSTGYLQVEIHGERRSLHREVATAFHGAPRPEQVCNHKNSDRQDNSADNLEWCTHAENMAHCVKAGRTARPWAGFFGGGHNTSKAVIATNIITGEERHYESAMCAVRNGFHSSGISRCCNGLIKRHKGFLWRYV